jgi:hypothetical protein
VAEAKEEMRFDLGVVVEEEEVKEEVEVEGEEAVVLISGFLFKEPRKKAKSKERKVELISTKRLFGKRERGIKEERESERERERLSSR